MGKYDHKKEFFSRKLKESQEWIMIVDPDDFYETGLFDKFCEVYDERVANLFLDWACSVDYMRSRIKIWMPEEDPSSAMISDGSSDISATLFIKDRITTKVGPFGSSISSGYVKDNLVKVSTDLKHNDVLFHGERNLLGHINPDSGVEIFQDPDGNVIDDTI